MLSRFLPKSIPFFEILASQSTLLQKQSSVLLDIITHNVSKEKTIQTLSSLKEELFQKNITLVEHLSETFITPIDKEDIHDISIAQKTIAFNIYTFGIKLIAYEAEQYPTALSNLLKNLQELLDISQEMVDSLPKKSNIIHILEQFNTKKNYGYTILIETFFELQKTNVADNHDFKNISILLIYYEEISKIIEHIQTLTDVLEQVMIKYV